MKTLKEIAKNIPSYIFNSLGRENDLCDRCKLSIGVTTFESLFNCEFMFAHKYHPDPAGIKEMFDEPVSLKDPGKEQYPNERFYHLHKEDI